MPHHSGNANHTALPVASGIAATEPSMAQSCADCNGQHGYVNDKRKLVARMKRIEGQVRAITNMIETDTYCIDILTQIAASTSALKSVALILLEDHLDSCVTRAAAEGGPVADEKMDEAVAAITRLVKS